MRLGQEALARLIQTRSCAELAEGILQKTAAAICFGRVVADPASCDKYDDTQHPPELGKCDRCQIEAQRLIEMENM